MASPPTAPAHLGVNLSFSSTIYNPREHKWKSPQQIRSISLPNIPNKKYFEVS